MSTSLRENRTRKLTTARDAIIPAEFMPGIDNADLGSHCFQYDRPSFREKAANGSRVM